MTEYLGKRLFKWTITFFYTFLCLPVSLCFVPSVSHDDERQIFVIFMVKIAFIISFLNKHTCTPPLTLPPVSMHLIGCPLWAKRMAHVTTILQTVVVHLSPVCTHLLPAIFHPQAEFLHHCCCRLQHSLLFSLSVLPPASAELTAIESLTVHWHSLQCKHCDFNIAVIFMRLFGYCVYVCRFFIHPLCRFLLASTVFAHLGFTKNTQHKNNAAKTNLTFIFIIFHTLC